jgi:hypothetical protein
LKAQFSRPAIEQFNLVVDRCPLCVKSRHVQCTEPCPLWANSGHRGCDAPFGIKEAANLGGLDYSLFCANKNHLNCSARR